MGVSCMSSLKWLSVLAKPLQAQNRVGHSAVTQDEGRRPPLSQSLNPSLALRNTGRSPAHLQAVLEGSPMGTHFICIFENSVIQDEGFAPFLHQHIGLSNEETPDGESCCLKLRLPNTRAGLAARLYVKAWKHDS